MASMCVPVVQNVSFKTCRSKRVVQNVSFKTDWLNQQAAISIGATGVPKIAAGAKTKAAESGL